MKDTQDEKGPIASHSQLGNGLQNVDVGFRGVGGCVF